MKKSLVLAMAMALGVTASAYAANPFSDVPAGHWAYDSIAKLAAAGVIDGYGDTTFKGDRLMTRYEMAQIVAKAMAKGANVDKLAAEFADELDALGVRVAALEKKSDNTKIAGQIRYHYASIKENGVKKSESKLRTRLVFTGKVNNDWSYVTRLQNEQVFHGKYKDDKGDYSAEDDDVKQRVAHQTVLDVDTADCLSGDIKTGNVALTVGSYLYSAVLVMQCGVNKDRDLAHIDPVLGVHTHHGGYAFFNRSLSALGFDHRGVKPDTVSAVGSGNTLMSCTALTDDGCRGNVTGLKRMHKGFAVNVYKHCADGTHLLGYKSA